MKFHGFHLPYIHISRVFSPTYRPSVSVRRRADKSRDNSCPRVLIPAVAQVAFDLNLKNDLDLVTYFSDQDGTTMEEFVNIRTRRTRSLNECGILCERNKNTPGTPSCLK